MPALPRLRTGLFERLSAQLRFVPPEAARRQLVRAEGLADEVFADLNPVARATGSGGGRGRGESATRVSAVPSAASVGERYYPGAWVVARLTGYTGADIGRLAAEGEMIPGAALLGDVCAYIEHLSEAAQVTAGEVLEDVEAAAPARRLGLRRGRPGGTGAPARKGGGAESERETVLTSGELCRRWNVSRRTLERLRALGLYARRVRPAAPAAGAGKTGAARRRGFSTLAYSARVVAAFERARGAGVAPGAGTEGGVPQRKTRGVRALSPEQVEAVIERARGAGHRRDAGERGAGSIAAFCRIEAATLAEQVPGLSGETIRRIVREHEERTGEELFPLRGGAGGAGAGTGRGDRAGAASRTSVHRSGVRTRVASLKRAVELFMRAHPEHAGEHPLLVREDAAEVLLAPVSVREGLRGAWPRGAAELLGEARLSSATPAEARMEAQRGFAYELLLHEARRLARVVTPKSARVKERLDELETMLRWATLLKSELVRGQLGLIARSADAAIAAAGGGGARAAMTRLEDLPGPLMDEALGLALAAVIEAVERFDPFKGGRVAAPVGIALSRVLTPWAREVVASGRAARLSEGSQGLGAREHARRVLADPLGNMHPWSMPVGLSRGVEETIERMDAGSVERRVMEARLGLAGVHPLRVAEAARRLGLTPARVRRVRMPA